MGQSRALGTRRLSTGNAAILDRTLSSSVPSFLPSFLLCYKHRKNYCNKCLTFIPTNVEKEGKTCTPQLWKSYGVAIILIYVPCLFQAGVLSSGTRPHARTPCSCNQGCMRPQPHEAKRLGSSSCGPQRHTPPASTCTKSLAEVNILTHQNPASDGWQAIRAAQRATQAPRAGAAEVTPVLLPVAKGLVRLSRFCRP